MEGYLSGLHDRERWLALRWAKAARIVAILKAEGAAGGRVLDVGCSVGATLALLAKEGARPVGVDMDREALRQARAETPAADLILASGDALPFRPGTFDGLIANHVLEYVRQEQAVTEWGRVLKPGAPLYLAAVNLLKFLPALPFRKATRRRITRAIHHGEDVIGSPRTLPGLRRLFRGWRLTDWSRRVAVDRQRFGTTEGASWLRLIPAPLWRALLILAPSWIFVARTEQ